MEERKRGKKKLTTFGRLLVRAVIGVFFVVGCIGAAGWYLLSSDNNGSSTAQGPNAKMPTTAMGVSKSELPDAAQQVSTDPELAEFVDASSEKNGKWYGLCKKRSIQSVDDFRRTVENDPALAVYYAGFNWEEAKIGSLKEDVIAYVAHRKGDLIQPTTKPIKLPKGDQFITDGERTARTYCCNDIDLAPSAGDEGGGQTAAGDPEFLGPLWSTGGIIDPAPLPFPPLDPPGTPDREIKDPKDGSTATPEPGTLALMGVGLLSLAALGRKRKQ